VAFELRDELGRRAIKRINDPNASSIDETNVVPADPDGFCARYVVAINAAGESSFGQTLTYPCVRTPPVTPPTPKVEVLDKNIVKITVDAGINDPATGLGVYELEHDSWVSPTHLFTANPTYPTIGEWNAADGVELIGLRPNTGYAFALRARSMTGALSKFTPLVRIRTFAETSDPGAPILDRIGSLGNLRSRSILQTFVVKDKAPVIAGLVTSGALVAIDLDDRPFQATVVPGAGALSSFYLKPGRLSKGLHTVRLGALKDGATIWTPTIEFRVK
jgi:hypothetical protein